MLATSSRLHTFTYASLLAIVLICMSVHMADFVAERLGPATQSNLLIITAIVAALLAPPASFLLCFYSHKLIKIQEQLHALAIADPLTNLLNRRAFANVYEREAARFKRTGQRMSLLLLDIDHFKHVNAEHGHSGGDVALKAVAETLNEVVRYGTDDVARWGGEEFAIVLSNTGRRSGIRAAARFRQAIEDLTIRFGDEEITLTVSIGVIECHKTECLEDAIERADRCLREAKRRGRNKVVAFPAPVEDMDVAPAEHTETVGAA